MTTTTQLACLTRPQIYTLKTCLPPSPTPHGSTCPTKWWPIMFKASPT